jgi:Mrp family chromosome partitioning ATPase
MSLDNSGPDVRPALSGCAYFTFSPKLLAMESPAKSPPAVAIHEMAGQLVANQIERGRRGTVVCSPHRGAGTSLIAANLAIAIVHAGISVLLVDGNLHEASLEKLIAPTPSVVGLQQVLRSSSAPLGEAIQREVIPGLSLLYAGGACDDASELVGGVRCGELLAAVMRDYDYTIVDAPPANRSSDARRLASCIGYGLIVARRNRTYVDDVATLAAELAEDRAEVIGTIYNAA